MSETEEDIRFGKDTGLLAASEAEDMLRELEFEHANVFVDDEDDQSLY